MTVESSTLNTKVGLLLQLFMLLSPYAFDRDLPWSLLPTCRCPSVTHRGSAGVAGRSRACGALPALCPSQGSSRATADTLPGGGKQLGASQGAGVKQKGTKGPLRPVSERGCPAPAELPQESVGKTQAGRGFNVQGTRILPSSNIDPKSFGQLLVLLFVAAFAEVASQKGKCNTVPTSATSWNFGSGRP